MRKFLASVALAIVGAALLSFIPAANASTYNLDFGTVDLVVTTSGSVTAYGVAGEVITGVSGTVGGVTVDTAYTGLWGPTGNQYQVNNGLYADQNGSPNEYTLHGVYGTGGADYLIDNVWFPSVSPSVDNDNGFAFLLSNGASDYIYGNCNPNQSCSGYALYAGPSTIDPPGATPLPSTWTMLIAGFAGFGFLAYRGTKKSTALAAA